MPVYVGAACDIGAEMHINASMAISYNGLRLFIYVGFPMSCRCPTGPPAGRLPAAAAAPAPAAPPPPPRSWALCPRTRAWRRPCSSTATRGRGPRDGSWRWWRRCTRRVGVQDVDQVLYIDYSTVDNYIVKNMYGMGDGKCPWRRSCTRRVGSAGTSG